MLSVSSALKVFGECVRLPLGKNNHYKQQQFFTLLFATSSMNWFVESVSNFFAGILPQADDCFHHVKKMSLEEVQTGFDGLIARNVKLLRRLNLFSKTVWLAIDFNDQEFYGKPNKCTRGSKHKNGTNTFYSYATASIVKEGFRLVIAQLPYLPLDDKTEVVKRLLDACRPLVRAELVLFDRGFFSEGVLRLLKARNLRYVMPAVRNKKVKKIEAGVKAFPTTVEYVMKGLPLRLVFVQVKKGDGFKTLIFCTNLLCWRDKLTDYYAMRWGIETSYRVAGDFRIMTCSTHPTVRLFFYYFSIALYNSWVLADIECKRVEHFTTVMVRLSVLMKVFSEAGYSWPPP